MTNWFISDTHFGHKNIVEGISEWTDKSGCRPFPTQNAHDIYITNLINDHVEPDDVLWHLGDWSFGGIQKVQEFRRRLNVRTIHLITGNHDHHAKKMTGVFDSISPYKELELGPLQLVLCHYPIASWNNMERGAIHLHGHVHGKGESLDGRYDVGVEGVLDPRPHVIGLISSTNVVGLKRATERRHRTVAGGNKFGS